VSFVLSIPVKFSDPSGHVAQCGGCDWVKQMYEKVMQNIGEKYIYKNNQADSVGDLMVLSLFQEPSATITGAALDDIRGDKTLQAKQKNYAEDIKADPKYGKEAFRVDYDTSPITFGEMGNNNMFEDATHSQTWTVRLANVTTSVNVSAAGDMSFNYTLSDTLDLKPDWFSGTRTGLSGFGYNVATSITGAVWHGLLGARPMEVKASWTNEERGQ
jgi:hypothetical protein